MGYREVGLMQVVEVLRRWQAQQSIRTIAQATGLARNSVRKYLRAAAELGLTAQDRRRRMTNSRRWRA